MKYMCLIYVDELDPRSEGSEEDIAAHVAFAREAIAAGAYVTCDALSRTPSATTVRVRDGRTVVSDGPFAETKEALGGFYMLECGDLDEAIAYAEKIPPARIGSIEIRPIMDIPGWDEAIGLAAPSTARRR
jgi:hypothetical protein